MAYFGYVQQRNDIGKDFTPFFIGIKFSQDVEHVRKRMCGVKTENRIFRAGLKNLFRCSKTFTMLEIIQ